jgi:hypothetical protein
MLAVGAVVKFNEDGLRWARPRYRPARATWPDRIGIIKVIHRDGLRVRVLWGGNKSLSDGVPLKFLEVHR